jgi:hypothetical protein
MTLAAGAGLITLGPWIAHTWLGKDVAQEPVLLVSLIGITTLTSVWSASYIVLAAINQHARMGLGYVAINLCVLGSMWLAGSELGWAGILLPLSLGELAMLAWVMPQTMQHTGDELTAFLRSATVDGWQRLYQRVRTS